MGRRGGEVLRICLTSDIHHPRSGVLPGALPGLVEEADPDVFVMAGDQCDGNTRSYEECLSHFSNLSMPRCLVLGNHDVWLRDGWHGPSDSEQKLERLLDISEEMGFHPLSRSPLVMDGVALAGNLCWYDYGYGSLPLPIEAYRAKRHSGYVWNDANFVRWRYTDYEFNQLCLDRLETQLELLERREDVEKVVVVTHHIPFAECVMRRGVESFDFFNAFMGSPLIGELIKEHPKARFSVFGHSHGVDIPDRRRYRVGGVEAYNVTVDFRDPCPYLLDTSGDGDHELSLATVEALSNEISKPTPFKRGSGAREDVME